MIDLEMYKIVLDSGLLLDHYLVLCRIRDGQELPASKRIQGFINLLNKKDFIEDGVLTEKALVLINQDIVHPVENKGAVVEDFRGWVVALHKKCQDKMFSLVGTKQVRAKIDTKSYSFLPNVLDMDKVLTRAVISYKLKDLDKIEKCLLRHITNCYNSKQWFPLMKYYIMKNNTSDMVTDMDNLDDIPEIKSTQEFV